MGRLELQATSWRRQGPCEGERSQITMLESGVRRKAPAPFGAGERLQSPTYLYSVIVGVIGSALRRSVALIGPSIYIVSRLLKHIPPGGIIATEAVVERLRQEAPAFAQRFEVWDPCLVLKGVEDECVSAFHLP